MTTDTAEKYNGWTNRETWNVMLWLENDEPMYRATQAHKRPFSPTTASVHVRRLMPNGTPDIRGRSMYARVNWQEVADALNEDADGA